MLRSNASAHRLRKDPVLYVDRMGAEDKERLGPLLYDIFCESYGALDEDVVCDEMVFRAGGALHLYRDRTQQVVGFVALGMQPLSIDGRRCGVIHAGAYFRKGTRGGGKHAIRRGLALSLLHKLRYPFRHVYYVIEALNPVPYSRLVRSFPRAYPAARHRRPPQADAVLRAVMEHRGLERSGEHPFVVRYPDPATHNEPDRFRSSPTLRSDPDIEFYLQQNPNYADGDILCAIVSLDLPDLLVASYRQLVQPLRRIVS